MPFRPCPNCGAHTARLLEASSQEAVVWYVRCHDCGHVWTVFRGGKETAREVTDRLPLPNALNHARFAPSVPQTAESFASNRRR